MRQAGTASAGSRRSRPGRTRWARDHRRCEIRQWLGPTDSVAFRSRPGRPRGDRPDARQNRDEV